MLRIIGGIKKEVIWRTTQFQEPDATFYQFGGVNLGKASPGRVIIVGVRNNGATSDARAVASVTVGSSAATLRARIQYAPTVDIWSVENSADETAIVSIGTAGSNSLGMGIDVWTAYGLSNATPISSASAQGSGSTTNATLNLTALNNSIAVAYAGSRFGDDTNIIWTGLIKDSNPAQSSGASASGIAAGAYPVGISSIRNLNVVAASWS